MDDNTSEAGRQYGGGYGGYGGWVECCDGVVDPLLLLSIILGENINISALHYLFYLSSRNLTNQNLIFSSKLCHALRLAGAQGGLDRDVMNGLH